MQKYILLISSILISLLFTGCFQEKEKTKFYGNVDLRTVSLGFRVSGKIKNLYFDEGQKIKRGELLASLDNDLYTQELKGTSKNSCISS